MPKIKIKAKVKLHNIEHVFDIKTHTKHIEDMWQHITLPGHPKAHGVTHDVNVWADDQADKGWDLKISIYEVVPNPQNPEKYVSTNFDEWDTCEIIKITGKGASLFEKKGDRYIIKGW